MTTQVSFVLIDRLGALRAEIATLQTELKVLEEKVKLAGPGTYEGDLFRATVSETVTDQVDWKSIAAKLNPTRQLVTAYTKVRFGLRLNVSARSKDSRAA